MEHEIKPLNCMNLLTPIPEAISNDPSCSNLHEISPMKDDNTLITINAAPGQPSWRIYENDEHNSKSTDALLEERECGDEDEDDDDDGEEGEEEQQITSKYSNNISFKIIRENSLKRVSNSNSNNSLSRASNEKSYQQQYPQSIVVVRSRSGSKNASKLYEPMSSESLTDSLGYMDDFDESCALITAENDRRKRMSSSNELIPKRNSLGVNKIPQSHRFSAGDADKLERGIKSSLPSTRSLKDS
jgi:hypothetical protein